MGRKTGCGLATMQLDVVKIIHVIKRTNANATLAKSLVHDLHVRIFHVVEINFNRALGGISHQLHLMPGFILPRRLVFIFGHGFPRSVLHDHDLATVRIRAGAQMHIIEIMWILIVEKHAAVAMIARVLGAAHTKCDHKVSHLHVPDQGDVIRAAHPGLVIILSTIDSKDVVASHLTMRPAFLISRLPSLVPLLKVLLKNQREIRPKTILGLVDTWEHQTHNCTKNNRGSHGFESNRSASGSHVLFQLVFRRAVRRLFGARLNAKEVANEEVHAPSGGIP